MSLHTPAICAVYDWNWSLAEPRLFHLRFENGSHRGRSDLFPRSPVSKSQQKRRRDWQQRLKHIKGADGSPKVRGCHGLYAGWRPEEVGREGVPVIVYTVLLEWENKNDAMTVRELCAFTKLLAGLGDRYGFQEVLEREETVFSASMNWFRPEREGRW